MERENCRDGKRDTRSESGVLRRGGMGRREAAGGDGMAAMVRTTYSTATWESDIMK